MTISTALLRPAEWCKSRGPDREGPACRSRMIEGHRVILRETRQSHSSKGINAMTARGGCAWRRSGLRGVRKRRLLTHQLFTAALRLTRNTQYAEDLAQEVMLRAYAGFGSFPDDTSLKAWLYRILHKTWISQYRKGNPNLMRYRWSASPTCN
jgi:hypothetical protein